jgi:hypothetical protein
VPEIRRAVRRIEPALAVYDVSTMQDIVTDSMRLERLGSFMMAFFAWAALLMATLRIYGLISYAVRQRRVEIGTRMALGAVSRDLLTLVAGGGLEDGCVRSCSRCGGRRGGRLVAGPILRDGRDRMGAFCVFNHHRCGSRRRRFVIPRLACQSSVADGRDP